MTYFTIGLAVKNGIGSEIVRSVMVGHDFVPEVKLLGSDYVPGVKVSRSDFVPGMKVSGSGYAGSDFVGMKLRE